MCILNGFIFRYMVFQTRGGNCVTQESCIFVEGVLYEVLFSGGPLNDILARDNEYGHYLQAGKIK